MWQVLVEFYSLSSKGIWQKMKK